MYLHYSVLSAEFIDKLQGPYKTDVTLIDLRIAWEYEYLNWNILWRGLEKALYR